MVRKDDQTMSNVPRPSGADTHPVIEAVELRAVSITGQRIKAVEENPGCGINCEQGDVFLSHFKSWEIQSSNLKEAY